MNKILDLTLEEDKEGDNFRQTVKIIDDSSGLGFLYSNSLQIFSGELNSGELNFIPLTKEQVLKLYYFIGENYINKES